MFCSKVTLLKLKPGYGATGKPIEEARDTVWCSDDELYVKTRYEAQAAGVKLEKAVVMWSNEYKGKGYTHAELDGERYKIESTARGRNSMQITLLLSRG